MANLEFLVLIKRGANEIMSSLVPSSNPSNSLIQK